MKSIQKRIEADFAASLSSLVDGSKVPFRIIAAFSGGPDSTALLLLLNHFKKQFSYDLAAFHINHGIRSQKECSEEDKQTGALCEQLGITLYRKRLSPGFLESYSKKRGCGVEAAARTYRYHSFEKTARQSAVPVFVALGHNSNDQVETVLMRLFSASSPAGLKGIPVKRGRYIRPLLKISRSDIEEYLELRQVRAVTDSSNLKTDFLRNKVRLNLIPKICSFFPGVENAVLNFQNDLSDILDHYNSLLSEACPWKVSEKQGVLSCSTEKFSTLPFVSRKSNILEQMNKLQKGLYSPDRRIPSAFFNPLKTLKSGTILKGYGILLENKGEGLELSLYSENTFGVLSVNGSVHRDGVSGYSIFHMDRDHPFKTDSYILELSTLGELKEEDSVVSVLETPEPLPASQQFPHSEATSGSLIVRTVLSDSELKDFHLKNKDAALILYRGKRAVCVLTEAGIILPKNGKLKKRSNIDSKSNDLCVIIKGRGPYVAGR